jgi:uncharacterized membrane protein YkvA (DUF1232 family)
MARKASHTCTGARLPLDGNLRSDFRLAWRLLRDDRVTSLKFLLPALMMLCLLSPIDPIPDFMLGLGQMDDLGVVIGAMFLLVRVMPWLAPADVVDEHIRDIVGAGKSGERRPTDFESVVDVNYHVR